MNSRGLLFAAILLLALAAPFDSVLAVGPQRKDFRELEGTSTPVYRQRSAVAWKTHGRIVGRLANPPEKFTLNIFKSTDKEDAEPYKVEELSGDVSVYETGWLLPGKYRIVVTAEGFTNYTIQEVEVRKGFDCIMDIKFGTHVYHIF